MTEGDMPTEAPDAVIRSFSAERPRSDDLREFVGCLRGLGQPAVLDPNGAEAWVPGTRAELVRVPIERTAPASPEILRTVLGQRGIWVASYMQAADPEHPANCFDYVCTDRRYDVEKLEKYGRRDIRRGLRCFSVRRCTWDELLEHGYEGYADTDERHGHGRPSRQDFEAFVVLHRPCRFYEVWGAWRDDALHAWTKATKVDNWVFITTACSRNEYLRDCPNNALAYEATRTFLVEEKRRLVSFGISSVQATSNIVSLHKFKVRMGFQPVPFVRTFVPRRLLRPLLKPRLASWFWDKVVAARPASETLAKVAGLSRLVSGRERSPLAWTEGLPESDSD